MLSLLINPLVLMLLLWLFARHEAELSYVKLLCIFAGITLLVLVVASQNPIIGLTVYVVLIPIALVRYCFVSLSKAIVITVIFLAWQVAYNLAWRYLLHPVNATPH